LRVLIIGPLPPPVHGNSFANEIVRQSMSKGKNSIDVINTAASDISSTQGSVFSFRKALSFFRHYLSVHKFLRADVVYMTPGLTIFGLLKYSPFALISRALDKPYVLHIHGGHFGETLRGRRGLVGWLGRKTVQGAAAGIVLSKSLRRVIYGLIPDSSTFEINNFVDDELLQVDPHRKDLDRLRILYLSNLMREKGILDLLEACSILAKRQVPFKLEIAGACEQTVKQEINTRLAELGSNAQYLGPVHGAEKIAALQRANVFVLPTYYPIEGQPIALLEAMASGQIVVTTDHGGIADVVSSRNGFFVPPRDPAALADVLSMIGSDLPKMSNSIGAGNAQYARQTFTRDRFSIEISRVLEQLCQRRHPK
jgi:glycosyltransferase involved in cell wall biosynthesis